MPFLPDSPAFAPTAHPLRSKARTLTAPGLRHSCFGCSPASTVCTGRTCACPAVLKDEDRELPFLGNMLPLLVRGIGVHHSGLLPILKEVVELLFQEQLIKVGPLGSGLC